MLGGRDGRVASVSDDPSTALALKDCGAQICLQNAAGRDLRCNTAFAGGWPRRAVVTLSAGSPAMQVRPQAEQGPDRQADDVEVVALDALDERAAAALDRVAAGALLPLAAAQVPLDRARRRAGGT